MNAFSVSRFAIPALMIALVAGCATTQGFPTRSHNPAAEISALRIYLEPGALSKYAAADDAERGGMSRKEWRNEVLEARIRADDLNFADFQQSLYEEGTSIRLGADFLTIGLTGAGAAAAHGAANALSAAAAAVTGMRASYDSEALYQKTLPVLIGQMAAKRKEVLVRIRGGEMQEIAGYPLIRGLNDLEDYYFAGSIPGALTDLAANSGAQAEQADQDLKDIVLVAAVAPDLHAHAEKITAFVRLNPGAADAPTDQQLADLARFLDVTPQGPDRRSLQIGICMAVAKAEQQGPTALDRIGQYMAEKFHNKEF